MHSPPDAVSVSRFEGSADEWDGFLARWPQGSVFHRLAWRSLIADLYGHDCPFLVARRSDGLVAGVLPLVSVRSRLFGRFLVSMPFVSYGGPVGCEDAVRALVSHAVAMARDESFDLFELRSAHPLPIDLSVSHRKITVVLSLAGGPDAVIKALPSKLRSQTRRAVKDGMEVRFGAETVDDFHSVFARHMRDLGTPAQPRAFFRGLAARFGDDAWFGCAYLRGRPIACGAGFRSGAEFELTWASALREFNRISANMGLYWAFIERAAASGLQRFNFGRCTPGSETHKFKRQWGAEDEALWWYQHSSTGVAATPSAQGSGFGFATRVWQRLPLSVATALGPRIVRYIP